MNTHSVTRRRPLRPAARLARRTAAQVGLALVVMTGLVVEGSGVRPVLAASVASTTSDSLGSDKLRCTIYWTGSSPNAVVKMRCYYSVTASGWTASRDINNSGFSVSPEYLTLPTMSIGQCTQSAASVAVGPQTIAQSLSGTTAIPAGGFEAQYTLTGASCFNSAYAGSLGTSQPGTSNYQNATWQYPSRGAECAGFAKCVWSQASGFPNYPVDWYPGGQAAVGLCDGLSVSGPSATVPRYAGDKITLGWTKAPPFFQADYRWVNSTRQTWTQLVSGTTIGNTGTTVVTFPSGSDGKTIAQVGLEIRCMNIENGVQTFAYQLYGGTGFVASSTPAAGCRGAQVKWPENRRYEAGEIPEFYVSFAVGAGGALAVEITQPFGNVAGNDVWTWQTLNVVRNGSGVAVTAYPATNLAAGFEGYLGRALAVETDLNGIRLRCRKAGKLRRRRSVGQAQRMRGRHTDRVESVQLGARAVEARYVLGVRFGRADFGGYERDRRQVRWRQGSSPVSVG